jgi:uncharacterized protein involved in exopolysaccharide biosynthesis
MSATTDIAGDSGRARALRAAPWRLPPEDLLSLLWGGRALMLGAFLVLLGFGLLLVVVTPTRYTAHSSLLIRLGPSYVYQPKVGDAARGAAPDNDLVVQSELEILQSDAVKLKTVQDIGLERLSPGLQPRADGAGLEALQQAAMRRISAKLKVSSAPGVQIARLTYADRDPTLAALVLNTLVDEYLRYRKSVLSDNLKPLDEERRKVQGDLEDAERAYQGFLAQNGIGDFDTEKSSLAQIYSQLLSDRYSVAAQIAEAEGRLAATRREILGAKPEIGLYRDLDHAAADKAAQLKVELQDLLSRYQPGAQPVRELQQKIAAEEALAASGGGSGSRRLGVNPVYQTLQTERNQLEAEAASLKQRDESLRRELTDVTQRRQTLTALEPRYEALARQRDLLADAEKTLAQREQESQAAEGLDRTGGDDSIKVVERAYPPTQGASARLALFATTAVFALFVALALGLLRAALQEGWPSRAAVERGLGLPILAVVPRA